MSELYQGLLMSELYQGLLMSELYQGLFETELYQGLLMMDLYLLCKVEQKRKQAVFSGTNVKLVFQLYFLVKSYIYMILHLYL